MLGVTQVSVAGYRSIKSIHIPVAPLTVFVGQNGVGKTNLYHALELIQAAARGTLAREIAAEGGFDSAFWAGTRQAKEPVRIKLGVRLEGAANLGGPGFIQHYEVETGLVQQYAVEVGVTIPTGAAFLREPQIKAETLTHEAGRRAITLLERKGPAGFARDRDDRKQPFGTELLATETALASLQDAGTYPDLHIARRTMLDWRFYHQVRTDAGSPLRRPCLAVTTPTLSSDGSDLAAVFATLAHIRQDTAELDDAVADAFAGARLVIPEPGREAAFGMVMPDYPKRVFEAAELSDGTLRFLALAGALLAYRLPSFVALNEPEASLHPDMMEPLARMIVAASRRTQIWLVTHSERLADAIAAEAGITPRRVIKRDGATWIEGLRLSGDFGEA